MKRFALVVASASALWLSTAAAQPNPGASLQAGQDPRAPEVLAKCHVPPPPRPAPPPAAAGAQAAAAGPPTEYSVIAIPGVIAAGQRWRQIYREDGNVADGIVGTDDGGLLVAQNDKSDILKLDAAGNGTVLYRDVRTGGSVSRSKTGALFALERALNPAVVQLEPQRRVIANKMGDDPLDCLGGVLNDLTADSKGGVYFTTGRLFHAAADGVVTQYGEDLRTNGIILSADERTLYVTNGPSLAAFDVQADGSLTNQREFAKLAAGGDGATIDSAGRIYVTGGGVNVIGPDGTYLGLIPTPFRAISVAFSGPDKKTLYAVATLRENGKQSAEIYAIDLIAQGYKGRAK